MNNPLATTTTFGKWMALTAALLGWLFDGLEMGLFPLVARPALGELVPAEDIGKWLGVITALFLVGAATGGVLFGWLGDRIGRVRSMMLSVLTYALVSGLCGFATEAWQIGVLRFLASLGMGGEWSLGVALINEIWPDRSRAFLAGLIGAAANVGYMLIAVVGLGLGALSADMGSWLRDLGLPEDWVARLLSHDGWRLLMMFGAAPALLTFFIRLFVPESAKWEREKERGATSHWANIDLLGVLAGCGGACGIVALWTWDAPLALRIAGTLAGLALATIGYTYPVIRYLQRADTVDTNPQHRWRPTLRRMLIGACLSGVALLGTWGSVQQAPAWANNLAKELNEQSSQASSSAAPLKPQEMSSYTQFWSSLGAVVGTILAALMANWLGRRITYTLLCLASMAIIPTFFLTNHSFDTRFWILAFATGGITASFYGWLPLYLPELFRTAVRATGQGFGFNFGRILAAIGVLQIGNLLTLVKPHGWGLAHVCTMMTVVYLVGLFMIWLAPETKGQPLPE
jgi:SHS family sialic acid transporter-like MFS transporter